MRSHRWSVAPLAIVAFVFAGAATFKGCPPPRCSGVTMNSGQADINAHGAGTTFCLSGTHNWTLTPKNGDTFDGPAILDGNHTTTSAIAATATNVTLNDLEIRNYVTQGDAFGAITTPDPPSATGWNLLGLNVHDNGNSNNQGVGAELGTGWQVIGGRYWHNVQEGLTAGGGASNDTVNGVELDHNSNPNICGHEGGGFKWVAQNITVKDSNIHDNLCMGLWADIGSSGTITHNTITNNANDGILWEISGPASIMNNNVSGNGFHIAAGPCTSYPFGGGIAVIDSPGPTTVNGNTVSNNCHGVVLDDGDSTGDGCGGCGEVSHSTVSNNNATNTGSSGYFEEDGDGPGEGQAQGNSFADNTGAGWCNFTC